MTDTVLKDNNWLLTEERFDPNYQGKWESIMHLSNGYLGIRSATEESYPYQTRGMFAAGCYNRCSGEVTELSNAADTCEFVIFLEGELFSMNLGKTEGYRRSLNLKTGELVRTLLWTSPKGRRYHLTFRRFVSQDDPHTYASRIEITPEENSRIEMKTGINARITNSGAQHFFDGTKQVFDQKYLFLSQETTQSRILFAHGCCCKIVGAEPVSTGFSMERRLLQETIVFFAEGGKTAAVEKVSVLFTSNDFPGASEPDIQSELIKHLSQQASQGYLKLFEKSAGRFEEFWRRNDILLKTDNKKLILALRFAQYNLHVIIPIDRRSSIAAKGLSGEGYKGHVFWDTEVFMLPYYLYTDPQKARQLLEYRFDRIEQAMQNAKDRGYRGIMFPWESADTGKEETPRYANMNILTGKAARCWAGDKEHHVTADVAYAALQYWDSTGDWDFMEQGGALLVLGCALFWTSRAQYNPEKGIYELKDIIGPDEYTEHVDNNAYSNYLSWYISSRAIGVYHKISEKLRQEICEKLEEPNLLAILTDFTQKIYLPKPLENGVIPQDDTFMEKNIINVEAYRADDIKQTILTVYSRSQVDNLQVLKQADTVMLFALLPQLFPDKVKKASWRYYEPKTIHDSSLSYAIYALCACDFNDIGSAYQSFLHAVDIDIGPNLKSSDLGIHAASMSGIWMDVVEGFAGVRCVEGELSISPHLPPCIQEIGFHFCWKGLSLDIQVSNHSVSIQEKTGKSIQVTLDGKKVSFQNSLTYHRNTEIENRLEVG